MVIFHINISGVLLVSCLKYTALLSLIVCVTGPASDSIESPWLAKMGVSTEHIKLLATKVDADVREYAAKVYPDDVPPLFGEPHNLDTPLWSELVRGGYQVMKDLLTQHSVDAGPHHPAATYLGLQKIAHDWEARANDLGNNIKKQLRTIVVHRCYAACTEALCKGFFNAMVDTMTTD